MLNLRAYTTAAYFLSTLPFVVPDFLRDFSDVAGHEFGNVCNSLLSHEQHEPGIKIRLTNVRVFDGRKFGPGATVVINGAEIESVAQGVFIDHTDEGEVEVVNGNGGYLLPGFIDAHSHPVSEEDLENLAKNGVTTTLSQACFSEDACQLLNSFKGVTDVFYSGLPATAPGSPISKTPGFPSNQTLSEPSQAFGFVTDQILIGAHHIKIIVGPPGAPSLNASVVDAVNYWAHRFRKRTVAHASDTSSIDMALDAGVDQIHHIAVDKAISDNAVARFVKQKTVSAPTLTIMLQIHNIDPAKFSYDAAVDSVAALHKAKVPILAGTDAHPGPGPPTVPTIPFGSSFHDELYLLVDAGLSTVEALNAGTIKPAEYFGLHDRGVIAACKRADLVLLKDDPIKHINATRSIERVWLAGKEFVDKKWCRREEVEEVSKINLEIVID